MNSIHARTIAALTVQQRLLGIDPLWTNRIRNMMAHIQVTAEAMQDDHQGSFIKAMRAEIQSLVYDTATHAWVKP